jgi:HAD superfamily hydrolase (TIGR01509 family)
LNQRPSRLYLDFDGVIMDSMALKLASYLFALAPYVARYSLKVEDVRRIQKRSAGLSRQKTIPLMVSELCGETMSDIELADALERFRVSDEKSREQMQLMPGALTFLQAMQTDGQETWILTGTPQEVIETTLQVFALRPFFAGVLGSPPGKSEYLRAHLPALGNDPRRGLFIGDSPHDQAAAREVGMPFIGLAQESQDIAAFDPGFSLGHVPSLANLLPWPRT